MLPRKIFESLHTAVAILVLFEQFLRKFSLNFLPLNLSVSPNMMHLVRTFSIMRALGVRLIANEKVRNYIHQKPFKMAGGGMHPPYTPPDNIVSYHNSNQPVWLRYDVRQNLSQLF